MANSKNEEKFIGIPRAMSFTIIIHFIMDFLPI